MLTGNQVRVRHAKNRLIPVYIDESDPQWRSVAERLLDLFRSAQGWTRAELEEEIAESISDNPTQLVHQGLAKLLEDRCEFDVESSLPPDEMRESVFRLAAARRTADQFNRQAVLEEAATQLGVTVEQVDQGMFADLKAEQRLMQFKDCTVEQILQRYNVALAQAVLLRSTHVEVTIAGETPARYRQLFRSIKFHRLICEIRSSGRDSYTLLLDGPLSFFSATQKYGMQLANFLPALLQCKRFELKATLRWGAQRKEKEFRLDSSQELRSHIADYGDYVPAELKMFAESFRKKIDDWEISAEATLLPVGTSVWTPDFVLTHRPSKKKVFLEVLGFWRRTDAEKLFHRLRKDLHYPFILAVSEQFNIDEAESQELSSSLYVFKRNPLPEEVVRLAETGIED